MKRLFLIFALALSSLSLRAQDERYAPLDTLLNRFFEAMVFADIDDKCAEMDKLIDSPSDSLARQHVAITIFEHYRNPEVMGEEAVAVHVFDKWFSDGTIPLRSTYEMVDARLFADINRSTLIGCEAPEIALRKPCGGKVTIPGKGRPAVIFFYDTACAKCRMEAKLLPSAFAKLDYDLDFYAVYAGNDKKAWREFRNSFRPGNGKVHVTHLWDPDKTSDYFRLYAVINTPKMYMTDAQGTVIGRRLEVENLVEMIPVAGAIQGVYEKYLMK